MRNVDLPALRNYNINPFVPSFIFIYPLITSENLMISDVFLRGDRNIALKTNGLIKVIFFLTLLRRCLDKIKAILLIIQSILVTI